MLHTSPEGHTVFVCPEEGCQKSFLNSSSLASHRRVHSGMKTSKSGLKTKKEDTASKCFPLEKSAHSSYESVFFNSKPHCNFNLGAIEQNFSKYITFQEGKRTYKCPVSGCMRSFGQSGNLKTHLRTHTGERPYSCPEPTCSQTFTALNSVKRHTKRYHPELFLSGGLTLKKLSKKRKIVTVLESSNERHSDSEEASEIELVNSVSQFVRKDHDRTLLTKDNYVSERQEEDEEDEEEDGEDEEEDEEEESNPKKKCHPSSKSSLSWLTNDSNRAVQRSKLESLLNPDVQGSLSQSPPSFTQSRKMRLSSLLN